MKTLTITYNVSDLTDEQIGHLEIAAVVQSESDRDEDFPGCEVISTEVKEVAS